MIKSVPSRKCCLEEKLEHYLQFTPKTKWIRTGVPITSVYHIRRFPKGFTGESGYSYRCNGNNVAYFTDSLWYLFQYNIPRTSKSKFDNLFKLAKVALCIICSTTGKESVLSKLQKILTPQRASLEVDSTRASIFNFQLNRHQGEQCYQYKPSDNVISRFKKVTWEYNEEHSSATNEK